MSSSSQPVSRPEAAKESAVSPPTTVINLYNPRCTGRFRWYELVFTIGRELDGLSYDETMAQAKHHMESPPDAVIRVVAPPPDLFAITREPTQSEYGAFKLHEMTPDEVLAYLALAEVAWRERIVLIPPLNVEVDAYAEAIKRRTGKYPAAIAFSHIIVNDRDVWHVQPYVLGMKNTHDAFAGAL